MFTGIVEAAVPVAAWEPRGSGARLRLPAPAADWEAAPGDSVAVSGCCLTVAGHAEPGGGGPCDPRPGADLLFDLSAETIERTWFAELAPGRRVNLERALRLGDRLGGHMVSGHVDGQGRLVAREDSGDGGEELTFEVEPAFARYLVEKGSVTIDGVSLTVVRPEGTRFRVAAIPVTLEVTSLGAAEPGQAVNLEADQVGKWIETLLAARE